MNTFDHDSFANPELIGSGGEGTVFRAKYGSFGDVAVKVYSKSNPVNHMEIKNVQKFSHHPNIVRVFGTVANLTWSDKFSNNIGYVMEYMSEGSVHDVIHVSRHPYSLNTAYSWILQASRAISYLHENNVIHRDVKPNNMLLCNNRQILKVCDFGLSRVYEDSGMSTFPGTKRYMAPEIINQKVEQESVKSVDVYSLAISAWEIITKRVPYDHRPDINNVDFRLTSAVVTGERPPLKPIEDEELCTLLERSWNASPSIRPSVRDVVQYFEKNAPRQETKSPVIQKSTTIQDNSPAELKKPVEPVVVVKPPILKEASLFIEFEKDQTMLINLSLLHQTSQQHCGDFKQVANYFKSLKIATVVNISAVHYYDTDKTLTKAINPRRLISVPLFAIHQVLPDFVPIIISLLKKLKNAPRPILIITPNFMQHWAAVAAYFAVGKDMSFNQVVKQMPSLVIEESTELSEIIKEK